MPLEFLSTAQVARYGGFGGVPSQADLERFFVLDDTDRGRLGGRRGDHNRLGFVLQATTVRYVGRFLEDPLDVPWPVVEYLAGQLGIADASCVNRYPNRAKTAYDACLGDPRRVWVPGVPGRGGELGVPSVLGWPRLDAG